MVNFAHAVIYRIINKETGENLYVGSTTDYNRRMIEHKSRCNNSKTLHYNLPLYKHIRELGGWDFVRMVLVEEVIGCQSKMQLVKREQFFIDSYNESKNAIRAYATEEQIKQDQKQYRNDNKDKIKEHRKQYLLDNKEKISEQTKQYRLDNKEKIKQYRLDNKDKIKEQKKQYFLDNKDKILEQRKQYFLDNKYTIKERQKKYDDSRKESRKDYDRLRYLTKKNEQTELVQSTIL